MKVTSVLSRWTNRPALFIFFLAVVVHLGIAGEGFWREDYLPDTYDEARYVFYGEEIRAGRGMHAPGYDDKPTAYVMPLFPLMIAAVGPDSLIKIRLAQLGLSASVAVMTFWIARHLYGEKVGWIAAILLLANLGWIRQPGFILTEPLFIVLMTAATGMILYKPESWRWLAGAGVMLGLAWLTRGAAFGALVFIFLYLWWRAGFIKTFMTGTVMLLVISPWVIRNYWAFDSFVPVSTQSGNVLAGAYNDEVYKNPWGDGWVNPDDFYKNEPFFNDEIKYNQFLAKRGREWIQANPDKLPKLMAAHFLGFVRPWFKMTRNPIEFSYELMTWGVGVLLLLYSIGYTLKTRQQAMILMWLIVLGGFLTHMLFFGIPRYRLPYAPLFAILQAVVLMEVYMRYLAPRLTKPLPVQ